MITLWSDLNSAQQAELLPAIREIFFQSSAVQEFASDEARQKFWQRWTEYYFLYEPEQIHLLLKGDRLAGYLTGCLDSMRALRIQGDQNPSLKLFEDLLPRFPAHLHMNFHSDYRGQGLGREILSAFLQKTDAVKLGVHIITAPAVRNRGFYLQNGFVEIETRHWRGHDLLFMGR